MALDTLLSSIISNSVIFLAIGFLLKNWIAARLSKSIEHEYEKKYYDYQTNINQAYETKASLFSANMQKYNKSREIKLKIKIDAALKIWAAIVKIKNNKPYEFIILDNYKEDELKDLNTVKNLIRDNINDTAEKMNTKEIESIRPVVSTHLWDFYYSYNSLHTRMLVLYIAPDKNEKYELWYNDEIIKKIIKKSLSETQMHTFQNKETHKFEFITKCLELKILKEINDILNIDENTNANVTETIEYMNSINLHHDHIR